MSVGLTLVSSPSLQGRYRVAAEKALDLISDLIPECRSLVVTGSVARGDAIPDDGRKGSELSDLDLVFLVPGRAILRAIRSFPQISEEASRAAGVKVSLAPLLSSGLRRVPPTVFYYELRTQARTIAGEDLLRQIPWGSSSDIRPQESAEVLVNYLMEVLRHFPRVPDATLSRALTAVADSLLILEQRYSGTISSRLREGQQLAEQRAGFVARGIPARLAAAASAREANEGFSEKTRPPPEEVLSDLCFGVEDAVGRIAPGSDVRGFLLRSDVRRTMQFKLLQAASNGLGLSTLDPRIRPGLYRLAAYECAREILGWENERREVTRRLLGRDASREETIDKLQQEWSISCPIISLA